MPDRTNDAGTGSRTARDLAQFLGCELRGDPETKLRGVASPERAEAGDLIYLESARNIERVLCSAARCVIAPPPLDVPGKTVLWDARPKLGFARAATWLAPAADTLPGVHPTAVVAASATLGGGVAVGPFAVIEDGVQIGENTEVGAFCFLGRRASVGSGCRLYPRVTLYAGVKVGERVLIHAGVVLGSDGFGYVTHAGGHVKFPQQGNLEVGDDVEIGANTTVDRGSLETTQIGAQVKIDNLVHVAHNVHIGDRTLIAAQTGIAGSSSVGANVVMGGQVGIADHCHLEEGSIIGAQAGVPYGKTIRGGQTVWGTPARPLDRFKKQFAWYARLPELAERIRRLEAKWENQRMPDA